MGLDKSLGAVFNRLLLFFPNITLPHVYDLTHIENKRKTAFQIHHLKLATHFGPCFSSLAFPPEISISINVINTDIFSLKLLAFSHVIVQAFKTVPFYY